MEQKDLPAAILQFTRATRLDPDFAEAYNQLGIVLAESGKRTEAEAAFRTALRISPYDQGVLRNLQILKAVGGKKP